MANVCVVIVTVDAAAELMPELLAHARAGLERFPRFAGFLGGVLHLSRDGTRLVQRLEWSTEAEYAACIDDPVWDQLPTTAPFMDAVASGKARMDARIYQVDSVARVGDEATPS